MQYFKNISTIEQLRKSYNVLAKQYHPDINHSPDAVRIMQDINAEYAAAFKWLQNHDSEHLNCYDKIDPAAYPEIISKIIGLTELTIEICGSWVWLTGKTWLYAEQLKSAGFKFSRSKKAWYWSDTIKGAHFRGRYSLNQIREKFGAQNIETQQIGHQRRIPRRDGRRRRKILRQKLCYQFKQPEYQVINLKLTLSDLFR